MAKQILLSGEVRSIKPKNKKNGGALFARQYQVEVDNGHDEVLPVVFVDFNLARILKVGEVIENIPVRAAVNDYPQVHVEFTNADSVSAASAAPVEDLASHAKRALKA